MGWTAEESWFDFQQRKEIFPFPLRPDRLWGPLSLLHNGNLELFPRE
jgi:hypothetical protein